jgi:hypothetical protein
MHKIQRLSASEHKLASRLLCQIYADLPVKLSLGAPAFPQNLDSVLPDQIAPGGLTQFATILEIPASFLIDLGSL